MADGWPTPPATGSSGCSTTSARTSADAAPGRRPADSKSPAAACLSLRNLWHTILAHRRSPCPGRLRPPRAPALCTACTRPATWPAPLRRAPTSAGPSPAVWSAPPRSARGEWTKLGMHIHRYMRIPSLTSSSLNGNWNSAISDVNGSMPVTRLIEFWPACRWYDDDLRLVFT